jgi:hypothetical protein
MSGNEIAAGIILIGAVLSAIALMVLIVLNSP